MEVVVLGSAAGGGFPQWNCNAPTSKRAREGSARAKWRTQASVAVSADGERWAMLNASPDARQQLLQNQCLWPREGLRDSPVRAVVLTSAEIDHVSRPAVHAGKPAFRAVGNPPRSRPAGGANPIFGALNPNMCSGGPSTWASESRWPGARPLGRAMTLRGAGQGPAVLEGAIPSISRARRGHHRARDRVRQREVPLHPSCARMTPELEAASRLGAGVLRWHAWSDDELVQLGISYKNGRAWAHMSINGGRHADRVRQARGGERFYSM